MALSSAEKQRRYRERQKQKRVDALQKAATGVSSIARQSFAEWFDVHDNSDFEIPLVTNGISAPTFDDDRGLEAYVDPALFRGIETDIFDAAPNSLGRAELIVGGLISAAVELATMINAYKKEQIGLRLEDLKASDMNDPTTRDATLAEILRLTRTLDDLNKTVRWTFPQWKEQSDEL